MYKSKVLNFISNVLQNKIKFCLICLRTERERKLLGTHKVKEFLVEAGDCKRNYWMWDRLEQHNICIICNAHLLRALRFTKALNHAKRICCLFSKFNSDTNIPSLLSSLDRRDDMLKKGCVGQKQQMLQELDENLNFMTSFSKLNVTNTMLVNRSRSEDATIMRKPRINNYLDKLKSNDKLVVLEDQDDLVIIETDIKTGQRDQQSDLATIVIDDDTSSSDQMDVAQPQKMDSNPSLQVDVGTDKPKKSTKRRNKLKEKTGPRLVPLANLMSKPDSVVNSDVLPETQRAQLPPLLVINQASQAFVLHPIVSDPSNSLYVPSLGYKVVNNQLGNVSDLSNGSPKTVQGNQIMLLPNNKAKNSPSNVNQPVLFQKQVVQPNNIVDSINPRIGTFNQTTNKPPLLPTNELTLDEVDMLLHKNQKALNAQAMMIDIAHPVETREGLQMLDGIDEQMSLRKANNFGIHYSDLNMPPSGASVVESNHTSEESLEYVTKSPILKRSVDWESQIPVDVITYGDSFKPNTAKRKNTGENLLVISHVVGNTEFPDDARSSHR